MTTNRDIPSPKSLVDYIFRWMGMEFIPGYRTELNAPSRGESGGGSAEAAGGGQGGGGAGPLGGRLAAPRITIRSNTDATDDASEARPASGNAQHSHGGHFSMERAGCEAASRLERTNPTHRRTQPFAGAQAMTPARRVLDASGGDHGF